MRPYGQSKPRPKAQIVKSYYKVNEIAQGRHYAIANRGRNADSLWTTQRMRQLRLLLTGSALNLQIFCRCFSLVRYFLVFDSLPFIEAAQAGSLDSRDMLQACSTIAPGLLPCFVGRRYGVKKRSAIALSGSISQLDKSPTSTNSVGIPYSSRQQNNHCR